MSFDDFDDSELLNVFADRDPSDNPSPRLPLIRAELQRRGLLDENGKHTDKAVRLFGWWQYVNGGQPIADIVKVDGM